MVGTVRPVGNTAMNIQDNLTRYLESERLLNGFFSSFDYCLSTCIATELERNGNRPVAACCRNRYHCISDLDHPAFERLRQEREKRFGKPQDYAWPDPVSPCEYHNPQKGCLLASHKSPICIAFLCRRGIDRLRSRYGIYAYDYLGVYYALEWILTGDLPDGQFHQFRESILEMTRIVQNPKRPVDCCQSATRSWLNPRSY